jgi:hypothetical protein
MAKLLSSEVTRRRGAYSNQNEEYLKSVTRRLTRAPKEILEAAMKEAAYWAVTATIQDSGNAAWHWSITGFRQADERTDRMSLRQRYNVWPVGDRGDKGANRSEVLADTIPAMNHQIEDMIYRQGRVAFTLFNPIDPASKYGERAGMGEISPEMLTHHAMEKARVAASKKENELQSFNDGTGSKRYQAGERVY